MRMLYVAMEDKHRDQRRRDRRRETPTRQPSSSVPKWVYIHLCARQINETMSVFAAVGTGRPRHTRQSFFGVDKETWRHQRRQLCTTDKIQIPKSVAAIDFFLWFSARSPWCADAASALAEIFIVTIKRLFYLRTTAKKCYFSLCRGARVARSCYSIRRFGICRSFFVVVWEIIIITIIITFWLHAITSFRGKRDYLRIYVNCSDRICLYKQRTAIRNLIQSVSNYEFLYCSILYSGNGFVLPSSLHLLLLTSIKGAFLLLFLSTAPSFSLTGEFNSQFFVVLLFALLGIFFLLWHILQWQ